MAVAVVVVAIVVVITVVAIVGLLLLLLLLLGFSFGWHIFHGYDLLVVQGCWLKHPSEAAAQLLQQQQLKQNKCPVRSGQVTTLPPLSPPPFLCSPFLLTQLFVVYFGLTWVN